MVGPRDALPASAGGQLSDRQNHHLAALTAAGEGFYNAMHAAEGSNPPGEHQEHQFQSRRMSIAATQLEIALMMARKAALETR
jgi:hypothetical protein